MTLLSERKCVPCRGGTPLLTKAELAELLPQTPDWQIVVVDSVTRLERVFKCKNFTEALAFTNKVGALADAEDHHPLIALECCSPRDRDSGRWGWQVTVQWWTHIIKGLHKNDFVMAAKVDLLEQ